MGFLSWVVVGLLAGGIASMVSGQRQEGCITKIAVGILGALIGSALARAAGYEGITEFGLRSVGLAALGATLLLLLLNALQGRSQDGGRWSRWW